MEDGQEEHPLAEDPFSRGKLKGMSGAKLGIDGLDWAMTPAQTGLQKIVLKKSADDELLKPRQWHQHQPRVEDMEEDLVMVDEKIQQQEIFHSEGFDLAAQKMGSSSYTLSGNSVAEVRFAAIPAAKPLGGVTEIAH